MLKKTDITGYAKDSDTNAIININNTELLSYKQKKAYFKKISLLETKIQNLESEIKDLKTYISEQVALIKIAVLFQNKNPEV